MRLLRQSLHFNKQDWLEPARRQQQLQKDVSAICAAHQITIDQATVFYVSSGMLEIRASTAMLTRLRQIEPYLIMGLQSQSWPVHAAQWTVRRDSGSALRAQLKPWVNPNHADIGKRSLPTAQQLSKINLDRSD